MCQRDYHHGGDVDDDVDDGGDGDDDRHDVDGDDVVVDGVDAVVVAVDENSGAVGYRLEKKWT